MQGQKPKKKFMRKLLRNLKASNWKDSKLKTRTLSATTNLTKSLNKYKQISTKAIKPSRPSSPITRKTNMTYEPKRYKNQLAADPKQKVQFK